MLTQSKSLRLRLAAGLFVAFAAFAICPAQLGAQSLGAAENFAVLGASTVTNTGASHISGSVGVSPGPAITGFPPGIITNGALHAADGPATQAHADLGTAYTAFAGLASPPANNMSGTDLGGKTLRPGVYRFNTEANSAGALTFDAQNDPSARFVIQIGTTLVTSGSSSVVLINGAAARNIYFQVGSSATLGSGSSFIGNILAHDSVTTVSGTTVIGRLLAVNGAVTLDTNDVTSPVKAQGDFNGDGYSDILWQNNSNGERSIWLMNKGVYSSSVNLGPVALAWNIVGSGDFNADGKADILWQNSATGQRAVWLMNGTTFSSSASLGTVSTLWNIRGSGDFNGDGVSDLLWQNSSTGQRAIWLMNGTARIGDASLGNVALAWDIAGSGDFNGDGASDILWENTNTGQRAVWLMNGSVRIGDISLGTIPNAWSIGGAGDFNGNGEADILWQNNNTGQRTIWLMNGTFRDSDVNLGPVALPWKIRNY